MSQVRLWLVTTCAVGSALLLAEGASASSFWPEQGARLAPAELNQLIRSRGARLIGNRAVIDDMAFPRQRLILSGFSAAPWPGGRLVYDASGLSAAGKTAVSTACQAWANSSGVRCVPRTNETGGYLKITKVTGSVSTTDVGYGGATDVSSMTLCCYGSQGHIMHEFGHALGLDHEQSRGDRDNYVQIQWGNIKPANKFNFYKETTTNYGAYDFRSIMHYGQRAFSKNGYRTILVLAPNEAMQTVIGQRNALSDLDRTGMAARYP